MRHHAPLPLALAALVALVGCATAGAGEGALEPTPDAPTAATATLERAPAAVASARTGFVVSVSDVEMLTAPSGKAWMHRLATGDNAFVGILRLAPGAAVPENTDPTEEYIYVLQGSGELTMDGQVWTLGPGNLVYMPPGSVVAFQNGPDEELVAVQIFAGPAPAAKYDAWTQPTAP